MRCRVVSWNIHACVGTDRRYDVTRVAEVLAALNADIIGLQEVDWRRPAEDGRAAFDHIATHLGMNAIEGPNLHDQRGHYGNGLLTRFHIADYRLLSLAYEGREPRGAIDASLEHDGHSLRVMVTHLGLKQRERKDQIQRLRDAALSADGSDFRLLLGDMNEWGLSRPLRRAFTPEPYTHLVTGRTFPSNWPLFPLDCIFTGPAPHSITGHVVQTPEARKASDHRPILADIEWPRSPE